MTWGPQDFKAARVRAGFSQSALAGLLGVTQKSISRHETGQQGLPSDLLLQAVDIILKKQEAARAR